MDIAKKTGASVVADFEIAGYFGAQG